MDAIDEWDIPAMTSLARSLISSWREPRAESIQFGQPDAPPDRGRFLAVYGLAAHTHRLGGAALLLIEADRCIESISLVRQSFETAVTSLWLAQKLDGGRAFANEFGRQRRAFARDLEKSADEQIREVAGRLFGGEADRERLASGSDDHAKQFWRMCHDFHGGADLYVFYRLMSEYCHPSMRVIDHYLNANDRFDDVASIRIDPLEGDAGFWLHFLARSLVWAGSAADLIEVSHRRKNHLAEAARQLEVDAVLWLKDEARARKA